ncbi:hypothetical protein V6N12_044624 [Hibiscus sabdariffa]|uniref:Uncharacterized protein n=1 Tax=Hibiscus sabdariffa TaxID=183260 RepID=A0ABR2AXI4_9ROSI
MNKQSKSKGGRSSKDKAGDGNSRLPMQVLPKCHVLSESPIPQALWDSLTTLYQTQSKHPGFHVQISVVGSYIFFLLKPAGCSSQQCQFYKEEDPL